MEGYFKINKIWDVLLFNNNNTLYLIFRCLAQGIYVAGKTFIEGIAFLGAIVVFWEKGRHSVQCNAYK